MQESLKLNDDEFAAWQKLVSLAVPHFVYFYEFTNSFSWERLPWKNKEVI